MFYSIEAIASAVIRPVSLCMCCSTGYIYNHHRTILILCIFKTYMKYLEGILTSGRFQRDYGTYQKEVRLDDAKGDLNFWQ